MFKYVVSFIRGAVARKEGRIISGKGTPTPLSEILVFTNVGKKPDSNLAQMRLSRDLKIKRLNKPVFEFTEYGELPGKTTPVPNTEDAIKALLLKHGGVYHTGRIKTYEWTHKGVKQFQCLSESVVYDRSLRAFIHSWSGPKPGAGYHTADRYVWIEGNKPLIQGQFYQDEA